jgi:hypothetical protein
MLATDINVMPADGRATSSLPLRIQSQSVRVEIDSTCAAAAGRSAITSIAGAFDLLDRFRLVGGRLNGGFERGT